MAEFDRDRREEARLLRLYLKDIAAYPLLSPSDEARLAELVQDGIAAAGELDEATDRLSTAARRALEARVRAGTHAQERFIESNLRLVVFMAKRYRRCGMALLDLIQEGNLGLIHAVQKFDTSKGCKFSTYAAWWIRQAITRGIANGVHTIRMPVYIRDQLLVLGRLESLFENDNGRSPTLAELADVMGVGERKLEWLVTTTAQPLSLSEPMSVDGDAELGEFVEDPNGASPDTIILRSLVNDVLEDLLARLSPREREIVRLRFGFDEEDGPCTLEELGTRLCLTRERVRQIQGKALAKLERASTRQRELLMAGALGDFDDPAAARHGRVGRGKRALR